MNRIRKSFTFEAAHQLESSFTPGCHECIHGHSYTVELVVVSESLNEDGMVLDFGELKAFKEQVMVEWDHGLILHKDKEKWIKPLIEAGVLKREKVFFSWENPTAEAMAKTLWFDLRKFLDKLPGEKKTQVVKYLGGKAPREFLRGLQVESVRVHETSTGWAEYDGPETTSKPSDLCTMRCPHEESKS